MINPSSLRILRCTKLRPAHPLDTQAAHKRDKQAKENMTAQLKRELGWEVRT